MAPRPRWNPKAVSEKGNDEMLTPNFIQAISMIPKGSKQRPVKAVETTVGGLFSGSLNKCLISGLGLLAG